MTTASTSAPPKRIGERLIDAGLIDENQLNEALDTQKAQGRKVVEMLIDLGHVGVDEIAKFLAHQPGTPSIELENYRIPQEVCELIPKEFALAHEVMPIDKLGKLLTVAMAFPLDNATIEQLREMTGLKVKALLCRSAEIKAAVERYYPKDEEASDSELSADDLATDLKLSGVVGLIRGIESLPTMPDTVHRVQELTESPDGSIQDVSAVIESDPPIAAKLLQLANSPAYGFRSQIDSVERAAALLGLKETLMVVMSSAVLDLTKTSRSIDYEQFWAESLACAQACRLLAREKGERAEGGLSTAGLLCGIGRFALAEAVTKRYNGIDTTLRGAALVDAEETLLGIAYPEAGYELSSHWSLPEEIAHAIRFHVHPERAKAHQQTVGIVAVAAVLGHHTSAGLELAPETLVQLEIALTMGGLNTAQVTKAYQGMLEEVQA